MIQLNKNLNTFGLIGMVLAAGLVFTQSAFTPAKSGKAQLIYGYDQSNPEHRWVLQGTEGYNCNLSDNYCKYVFETPPTNNTKPENSEPLSTSPANIGSYQAE